MSARTKVLLEVLGEKISANILATTPEGLAITEEWVSLGTLRTIRVKGSRGGTSSMWLWASKTASGITKTKLEATDALLEHEGYEAVPLIATIPDLLADLK